MRTRSQRRCASIALCSVALLWVGCRSHADAPETPSAERAPIASTDSTARLSLDALAGAEWILRAWDQDEPAPDEPEVTLTYRDGRFAGTSGCNRYTAAASTGESPGALSVGPIGSSRMACPEPQAAVEARFLKQLARVTRFGLRPDRRLALSYEKDGGGSGTMLFEERRPARNAAPRGHAFRPRSKIAATALFTRKAAP